MLRAAVLTWALLAAAPATALDLPARAQALLDQGHPYVEVRPDRDGSSGQVHAAIDIAATPEAIWAVMTDCALAPRMVANLKSCRIVERDPAGRWDVREQISRTALLPSVRSVFRCEFDRPRSMRFHRTGGDLKVMEGEWRLEPRGGVVRVTYEARAAAPFSVPGWLARAVLRRDVPAALLALRREALARTP